MIRWFTVAVLLLSGNPSDAASHCSAGVGRRQVERWQEVVVGDSESSFPGLPVDPDEVAGLVGKTVRIALQNRRIITGEIRASLNSDFYLVCRNDGSVEMVEAKDVAGLKVLLDFPTQDQVAGEFSQRFGRWAKVSSFQGVPTVDGIQQLEAMVPGHADQMPLPGTASNIAFLTSDSLNFGKATIVEGVLAALPPPATPGRFDRGTIKFRVWVPSTEGSQQPTESTAIAPFIIRDISVYGSGIVEIRANLPVKP